jgi:sigma-54 dependent transcriptional regulator, acetoin dehydrogenase operon transcriptional activator AcoR
LERRHNILFLGMGPSSLHILAEGWAHRFSDGDVDIISASMTPRELHPLAAQVMGEQEIDVTSYRLRTPLDIEVFLVDLVVTLGDFDQSCRPCMPGMPPHLHWDVPEPAAADDEHQDLLLFREARDLLEDRVRTLFASGILQALFTARKNFELLLDNQVDGMLAHTTNRRIFYFNQAAEEITGYDRNDILGKDCHDVFPGRFCGGMCLFCAGGEEVPSTAGKRKRVTFRRPGGEQRVLEMLTTPLTSEDDATVGALISFRDITELDELKRRLRQQHSLSGLVGRDPKMRGLFNLIREVGAVQVSVLIEGESGTGKELVANAIHELSPRGEGPFVAVNCGALPEGILESELFGHVRGAFTGAVRDKKGRFELADGGTIFLDEVGELSGAMQVALLRVLQERTIQPVGGEKTIEVDVRVISATNRNLRQMMEKGDFRRDLFYRLCVVPIEPPPLRERRLDIALLTDHFLEVVATETGRELMTVSPKSIEALTRYPWPGNVRELRNAIEYAYVKCHTGSIEPEHLPPEIREHEDKPATTPGPTSKLTREQIVVALAKAGGNKKRAAELLGVGRATLYRNLAKHELS